MNENYTVDLTELEALARRTDNFAAFVKERVLAADAAAAHLASGWTGAAADAFQLAHHEWLQSAKMFAEQLTEMVASLHAAHEAYSAAFAGNSSMLLQGRS